LRSFTLRSLRFLRLPRFFLLERFLRYGIISINLREKSLDQLPKKI
jgi:hypothetical protein